MNIKPEKGTMTVRDLITKLQALPEAQKDLPVLSEGCDCYGEAGDIVVSLEGTAGHFPYVMVTRVPGC